MATSPSNKNMLGQTGFRLAFERLPNVTYFSQSLELPGVNLGVIIQNSPILDYPIPGEKLTFEPFNVTFRVDEDLSNYVELFNWLEGIVGVDSTEQRRLYQNQSKNESIYSDATLMILTSKYNPNLRIKFKNVFPESITALRFDTTASDIEYLECTANFRYTNYTIERYT
jgi:hypothetical protein